MLPFRSTFVCESERLKMPRSKNPFFRFKQFVVWHNHTALKVCTEACILGAYVDVARSSTILDIGTGTGILALMAAQRAQNAQIEAVELNSDAAQQARENAELSPFGARIAVRQMAVQDFWPPQLFDLIVCNPPFFSNHLRSPQVARNLALHTQSLSFEDLAEAGARLLGQDGRFVVLLPKYETALFEKAALQKGFFQTCQLVVFQRIDAPVFRMITTFQKTNVPFVSENLYIHQTDGAYSEAFRRLLQDYYLDF